MGDRIDYSNLKKLTGNLKRNLSNKYKELGKINQDAGPSIVSSSGTGSGASVSDTNVHQESLDTLFNQNTFNGNLIIGGITADFIETDATRKRHKHRISVASR